MKRKIAIAAMAIIVIIGALIFRPVPIVKEEKALVVSGVVKHVKLTKGNDFVFRLQNDPTKYYINRGIEAGLDFDQFKQEVLNQSVVFKYPKYWTPLDWNNEIRHISKVEKDGKTLFTELRQ